MMRATLSIRPVLNAPALGVTLVATLLALAVFGLEPAVQLARTVDIRSALAAGASGVRPRLRRQRMVIRWQVAIAAGFFIVATMFIRGTIQLARHDTGVEMDRLAVAALDFKNGSWDEVRIRRTVDRVMEEARKDRAVDAISASTGLPFGVMPSIDVSIARPEAANELGTAARRGTSGHAKSLRDIGDCDCARTRLHRLGRSGFFTGSDSQRAHRAAGVWVGRRRRPNDRDEARHDDAVRGGGRRRA